MLGKHISPYRTLIVMAGGYATPEGTAAFRDGSAAHPKNYKTFENLTLSNVGIGTYLGDPDSATDNLVVGAVRDSVRAGVNVIDTAINYRSQKAERAVGKAISEMIQDGMVSRDQIFLSTKGGYVTNDADSPLDFWTYVQQHYTKTGVIRQNDISSGYHCMSVPFLKNQLERSLENLGVDCIDLVYLHNVVEGQYKDASLGEIRAQISRIMEWYEDERRDGRIRYYGLATWDCFRVDSQDPRYLSLYDVLDLAREAGGKQHGFRFVQLPYNMYLDQALRTATQEVDGVLVPFLDAASKLDVGVFTSVPFMQGRLLEPGVLPEFGTGTAAMRALQFIRSTPGVLAPLSGHKSEAHTRENLRIMSEPPLSEDEFALLLEGLLSGRG